MLNRQPIKIIGAGFSGLTLAYYLRRLGVEVEIVERSPQVGGLIHSLQTPFGLVETAANGFINSSVVEELLNDLQVPLARPGEDRSRRYIFRSYPRRWPLNVLETAQFIYCFLKSLLRGRAWMSPKPAESIWTWGIRVLGAAPTQWLLTPALRGIYAGDVRQMSASLVLKRLFAAKDKALRSKGLSGTVAPHEGMGQLIEALRVRLQTEGVKFHFECHWYLPAYREQIVVVATSVSDAADIVQASAPQLAAQLRQMPMLPLVSATLFFAPEEKLLRGFGCLFPEQENKNSLGVLFGNGIFEGRSSEHVETWIMGGAQRPDIMNHSDVELLEQILSDRQAVLESQAGSKLALPVRPKHWVITRWPKALPHYTLEWEKTLPNLLLPNNVYLFGNYLGKIGLGQILVGAKELAEQLVSLSQVKDSAAKERPSTDLRGVTTLVNESVAEQTL